MKWQIGSQFYNIALIVWLAFSLSSTILALISSELLNTLSQLLVEPWPGIRDSVTVNKSNEWPCGSGRSGSAGVRNQSLITPENCSTMPGMIALPIWRNTLKSFPHWLKN